MTKKLLTISLSVLMVVITFTSNVFATGLGDNPTIGDVLNTVDGGFPSTSTDEAPSDAWVSVDGSLAYQNGDYLIINILFATSNISYEISKTISLTKENNNYKSTGSVYGGASQYELVCVMDDSGKLSKIEVTISTFSEAFTFEPIGNRKTLKEILQMYANDFPTIESNKWSNLINASIEIYKDEDSNLVFTGLTEDDAKYPYSILLSPDGTDYVIDYFGEKTVFTIVNNKLQSILVEHSNYGEIVGIYSNYVRIDDVLDTVPNEGFPTTLEDAWVSSIGDIMYYANNKINMTLDPKEISENTVVQKIGNNYETAVIDDAYKFVFVMNSSGELQQINRVVDGSTLIYKPLGNRKNLEYVLKTLPYDFPESKEAGWVNGSNSDIVIFKDTIPDNPLEMLSFYVPGYESVQTFPTTIPLISKGSNYQLNQDGIVIDFIMRSNNILKSIKVVNMPEDALEVCIGTYLAPVTIDSILPADFPITKISGWISDSKRLYKNGLALCVDDLGSVVQTNTLLESIPGTNDYKYDEVVGPGTTISFTFEMDSNDELEKITVQGDDGFNGEYEKYKFTNNPISIPVGYTGDLEFVTNASYTNDSDVVVKVDGNTLTQNTQYTVQHGSTHVKLLGSYISTLPIGTHTITIGVTGFFSEIGQEFTITALSAPEPFRVPNTGLEDYRLLLRISSLSLLVIGTYMVSKKKKDN